jgi:hypothetical protein
MNYSNTDLFMRRSKSVDGVVIDGKVKMNVFSNL